jgi:hypothetical protein
MQQTSFYDGLRNQAISRFDRWSMSEMAILQQLASAKAQTH